MNQSAPIALPRPGAVLSMDDVLKVRQAIRDASAVLAEVAPYLPADIAERTQQRINANARALNRLPVLGGTIGGSPWTIRRGRQ